MAETAIPTHPSNRTFIDQLKAWGCEIEEGGEKWRARFPNGKAIRVFAPTYHDGNPTSSFNEAYAQLDVSPQEFWRGPIEAAPKLAAVPSPTAAEKRGSAPRYINKVLDCLVQFGAPMSVDKMAQELSLTTAQVSSACSQLVRQDVAESLKRGVFIAKQYAVDYRVGVDVAVTGDRHEHEPHVDTPPSAPAPSAPLVDLTRAEHDVDHEPHVDETLDLSTDEVMEIVLDLMFPSGMHIRAADLKVISDWIESTKRLLDSVRTVES